MWVLFLFKQTKEGYTPLYLAAQSGHSEVIKPLVFHGADHVVVEEDGWTALQVCRGRFPHRTHQHLANA